MTRCPQCLKLMREVQPPPEGFSEAYWCIPCGQVNMTALQPLEYIRIKVELQADQTKEIEKAVEDT